MAEEGISKPFSISLPLETVDYIEKVLIPYGHYGKKRATICQNLILERVRQLDPVPIRLPK